ncbi:hypothetical protein KSX_72210 [Ktedonospora formicarum]|uniref:Uncharacterized protein n=1 Tax=Ktedonospora formicarum TaxID=2778364 RepID=A0A8J3I8B7_9CHLR|nr:hypothetical protein KSX_72210 [Ktedonospora formicarum]
MIDIEFVNSFRVGVRLCNVAANNLIATGLFIPQVFRPDFSTQRTEAKERQHQM